MKKFITILATVVMMLSASQAFAQISLGAGYLNGTDKTTAGSESTSANMNGFYAGISFALPLAEDFSLEPGIYYSMMTANKEILGNIAKGNTTEQFVNIPVYFNFGTKFSDDMRLFLFAGPTLQYGLSSQTRYAADVPILDFKADVKNDNYKDGTNYGRTNVLVGGGFGVDLMDMLRLTVGYDYGLVNLYTGSEDVKRNKSYLKLGAAYLF